MEDTKTTEQSELEANLAAVSPAVAEKFKSELEASKGDTPPADAGQNPPVSDTPPGDDQNVIKVREHVRHKTTKEPATPAAPPASEPAAPPATTAATVEPAADDDLSKQYPDGKVPIAALIAERKKRQELEQKMTAPPSIFPPAPAQPVPPAVAPNAAPAPQPPVYTPPSAPPAVAKPPIVDLENPQVQEQLWQDAFTQWQKDHPGEYYNAENPAHFGMVTNNKNRMETAYKQFNERQMQTYNDQQRKVQIEQRLHTEIIQPMQRAFGPHFESVKNAVLQAIEADPKEKYYINGAYQEGNFQPLIDFANQVIQKMVQAAAPPPPQTKTDADKVDDITALPRSGMIPAGDKGKSRTRADIDKMISDGSWAKLPAAEREAIIDQIGGGPI